MTGMMISVDCMYLLNCDMYIYNFHSKELSF